MQVMLEATVVVQTLHLVQATNSSFRNHLGSFFSKKKKKTNKHKLPVFWLFFHLSLLKERIFILNENQRASSETSRGLLKALL